MPIGWKINFFKVIICNGLTTKLKLSDSADFKSGLRFTFFYRSEMRSSSESGISNEYSK